VPYINCLDSNQTFDDDDFANEQFLTDLNKVNNKQHNRVQVNEEETVVVNLGSSSQLREIRIGVTLDEHEHAQLKELLKEFVDVFAWSYDDMPGIDPEIAQHEIPTLPDYKPVEKAPHRMVAQGQRRGGQTVEHGFHSCDRISHMASQHSACTEIRREGSDVCRLSRLEQSLSKG